MALQDIPQRFSCMQFWQMAKPQRHDQQKRNVFRQQWQSICRPRRRLDR